VKASEFIPETVLDDYHNRSSTGTEQQSLNKSLARH